MPRNKNMRGNRVRRTQNGKNRSSGGSIVGVRGNMGYEQVIRVSATVAISPTTGGNAFQGICPFGAGSGTQITPYSAGTNYATLSQWGDLRCSKIVVTPLAQLGVTNDTTNIVMALDSTGSDLAGSAAATGAWDTIRSRQSSKLLIISPVQTRVRPFTFRPVELNNREWAPQSALSNSANAPIGCNWGVLYSSVCTSATPVNSLCIDWYFDVREPTLSGVLLGTETPELRERLDRLARLARPSAPVQTSTMSALPSSAVASSDAATIISLRKEIADARKQLLAVTLKP